MWNPPTSSESASTRSKGGRLVSAMMATKKITKGTTPVRMMFQLGTTPPNPAPDWNATMPCVLSVPLLSTTATADRPMAAS